MALKTVEEYISGKPETQQHILIELHRIIKATAPELKESIKWGVPWYSSGGNICYLAAQTNHVNFGFAQATAIPDPLNLLEGTGAGMRHIKFRAIAEINEDPLRDLIREAVAFQNKK